MLQRCPDDQEIALREGCGGLANRQQKKLGLVYFYCIFLFTSFEEKKSEYLLVGEEVREADPQAEEQAEPGPGRSRAIQAGKGQRVRE
jgi:hypothetical protein